MKKQQGTILIVSLLLMFALTALGIASMKSSMIGDKITGSILDKELAKLAAKSAMNEAKDYMNNTASACDTTCTSAPCSTIWAASLSGTPRIENQSWWDTNSRTYSGTIANVSASPQFVIENIAAANSIIQYYKITARGVGISSSTTSVIEFVMQKQTPVTVNANIAEYTGGSTTVFGYNNIAIGSNNGSDNVISNNTSTAANFIVTDAYGSQGSTDEIEIKTFSDGGPYSGVPLEEQNSYFIPVNIACGTCTEDNVSIAPLTTSLTTSARDIGLNNDSSIPPLEMTTWGVYNISPNCP